MLKQLVVISFFCFSCDVMNEGNNENAPAQSTEVNSTSTDSLANGNSGTEERNSTVREEAQSSPSPTPIGKMPNLGTPGTERQPDGICTRDINQWGHPSTCTCLSHEVYVPESGMCVSSNNELPYPLPVPSSERAPDGICTQDINQWGFSSTCTCRVNETYSPQTGLCHGVGGLIPIE